MSLALLAAALLLQIALLMVSIRDLRTQTTTPDKERDI